MANLKKVQGVIETVSVKPLATPDKFENTHRASIKVGGEWYGLGSIKGPVLKMQNDNGDWKPLGEGSEVLVKYEENGDFRNAKRSNITVLEFVEGNAQSSPPKPPTTTSPTTGGGGNTSFAKRDAGIEAGHAINGAIQVLRDKMNGELDVVALLNTARQIHAATRALQEDILNPPSPPSLPDPVPPAPASKAKRKPTAPVTQEDWQDDEELPF